MDWGGKYYETLGMEIEIEKRPINKMKILAMQLRTLWPFLPAVCGLCQLENCDNQNNSQGICTEDEEDE
ncbi:hypothetical protein DPMN_041915 [Dreissena polymorpha]|uniref:Uncharacterized protein n=1 Tax=Dreissena polymorpha TaxID=45954 RepID=A0A9D4CXR4_DREPO|nr:hypothetical protein DPMN_041915 [Dreissena polymorpha]